MITHAQPFPSSAAASTHGAAIPALELLEARKTRDALKLLLRKEQAAMAEFLVALAGFDRDRGWESLGHASLFAFLHFELGLSNSAAFYRMSAARLLQRIPELLEPIANGRLCLSTTAELAKVVTEANWAEVAPRFFGLSARDAREVVAELQPRAAPPLRAVVTSLAPTLLTPGLPGATPPARLTSSPSPSTGSLSRVFLDTDSESLLTSEEELTHPARGLSLRDAAEPLTADLRRLHITVSLQLLKKIEAAKAGLSHVIPGATAEQVLEAALDLLLERQARARGLVKRPRASNAPIATPNPNLGDTSTSTSGQAPMGTTPNTRAPVHRRTGSRETIPAALKRAVWERDQGRCQWPLDGGGRCGSTHLLELDHLVPWALGGTSTLEGLRLLCHGHNQLAARQVFGERCVKRYRGRHRAIGHP
jgi:hypothetical protein